MTVPAAGAAILLSTHTAQLDGRTVRVEPSSGRSADERKLAEPSNVLVVKSMSWATDDDALAAHFDGCVSARVIVDHNTGLSKG